MGKHTPGPWKIGTSGIESDAMPTWRDLNPRSSDEPEYHVPVCKFRAPTYDWPIEGVERLNRINEANARLIAAAPEMLEALKYVLALSEGNSCLAVGMLVEHHSKIRQVIAKAEGESA